MPKLKSILLGSMVLTGLGFDQTAFACSPNMPNYGNCVRQQQQAWQLQQQQHAMQQIPQPPRRYEEPIDLSPPAELLDKAEITVAFSPSTGAVGVMSFAHRQSQTHYHFMAGQETLALASCVASSQGKSLGKVDLNSAEKFIKRHGKKSDCQVVKKTNFLQENLIAILQGKLSNGKYQLFMATRPSNRHLYSQEQGEFKQLLSQCQAVATHCQIVGQFGDKTELY